jgi:hypothetical protein
MELENNGKNREHDAEDVPTTEFQSSDARITVKGQEGMCQGSAWYVGVRN